MAPIKTSVLGAGNSLQVFHYPIIGSHPDLFTLHSVLERSAQISPSGEVIKSTARDRCGPNVKIFRSLDEVVADKEVELVVNALPPALHYETTKRCLEAGKHVLIEKPIAVKASEGKALIELAESKGLVVYTFQNRRWDANFLAIQELIKSRKLGQLNEFTSHYDRYMPLPALPDATVWKEQPGNYNDSIYNLGSHLIDQVVVLFGRPKDVMCMSWPMRGVEGLDDSFVLHMRYPATHPLSKPYPLLVTVRASMMSPMSPQLRFCVKGDKGSYTKYGLDQQSANLKRFPKGPKAGDEGWGKEDESMYGTLEMAGDDFVSFTKTKFPTPNGTVHVLYRDLHRVIREGSKSQLVKPEESVMTIEIIEAGVLSSKEGRWVTF